MWFELVEPQPGVSPILYWVLRRLIRRDTSWISVLERGNPMFVAWLEQELLERLRRSLAACRAPFRVPNACSSNSGCSAHSETTTRGVSEFANFLVAPLNETRVFALPAKHLALTPDLHKDARRFQAQVTVYPGVFVLSPHAKPWVQTGDGSTMEHFCYANNTTDQELLGIDQFGALSVGWSSSLRRWFHGLRTHRAVFNVNVSRAEHARNHIVRRFAPKCFMCITVRVKREQLRLLLPHWYTLSPHGETNSFASLIRHVRRFGPHVGHHDSFASWIRHVRRVMSPWEPSNNALHAAQMRGRRDGQHAGAAVVNAEGSNQPLPERTPALRASTTVRKKNTHGAHFLCPSSPHTGTSQSDETFIIQFSVLLIPPDVFLDLVAVGNSIVGVFGCSLDRRSFVVSCLNSTNWLALSHVVARWSRFNIKETLACAWWAFKTWNHCTSTPHRSETNGIGERAVCRVKEGTSAVLLQLGLDEKWWADSIECHCYLRNIQDLLSDGKTPYERRFGEPFKGPIIPFGSMIEYHPISAKDQSRVRILLGYVLYAGGIWKGDIVVADMEELEQMDASEIHAGRLSAKEVLTPM